MIKWIARSFLRWLSNRFWALSDATGGDFSDWLMQYSDRIDELAERFSGSDERKEKPEQEVLEDFPVVLENEEKQHVASFENEVLRQTVFQREKKKAQEKGYGMIPLSRASELPPAGSVIGRYLYLGGELVGCTYRPPSEEERWEAALSKRLMKARRSRDRKRRRLRSDYGKAEGEDHQGEANR